MNITVNTTKNNIISTSVDCCVVAAVALSPLVATFIRLCMRCLSPRIRLAVVSLFYPQQPRQFMIIVVFLAIFPPQLWLIVVVAFVS